MNPLARAATELATAAVPTVAASPSVDTDTKASAVTWDSLIGWNVLTGSSAKLPSDFRALVLEGFKQHPVVAACVRLITSTMSEAPIHVARRTVKDGEEKFDRIADHAAEELLREPNERDPGMALIERMGAHFLLGVNGDLLHPTIENPH